MNKAVFAKKKVAKKKVAKKKVAKKKVAKKKVAKKKVAKKKVAKKKVAKKLCVIRDFGLKLAVLNEVLSRGFRVKAWASLVAQWELDDMPMFEVVPAARRWVHALEFTKRELASVESLTPQGDDDIYFDIIPGWDGEQDDVYVKSLAGIEALPNLTELNLWALTDRDIDTRPLLRAPRLLRVAGLEVDADVAQLLEERSREAA
jgi:hypothetical protein